MFTNIIYSGGAKIFVDRGQICQPMAEPHAIYGAMGAMFSIFLKKKKKKYPYNSSKIKFLHAQIFNFLIFTLPNFKC